MIVPHFFEIAAVGIRNARYFLHVEDYMRYAATAAVRLS